ncbi:MAG: TfoX/Sxy family protein [Actinomycetota bacterium]|nr:TfoX/Sxy family protein [Actinomycetota bacterium]
MRRQLLNWEGVELIDSSFAERIREILVEMAPFVEKKMFGGVGFLVEGKMAVGVSSGGQLIVRVEHEETYQLIELEHVTPMTMNGRIARGWVFVDQVALERDEVLRDWIERGLLFALRSATEEAERATKKGRTAPKKRSRNATESFD